MIVNGMITLGRDSELKFTQSGTAVLGFSGAYNTGYGQNKETHWLKCSIFGKQAEALQQHLVKSTKLFINGKDLKVATYPKNDGTTGVSLECIVNDIEFAGGQNNGQNQGQQQQANNFQQPQQAPQQPMNPQQYKQTQAQGQQPQQGFQQAPNSFQSDDVPF